MCQWQLDAKGLAAVGGGRGVLRAFEGPLLAVWSRSRVVLEQVGCVLRSLKALPWRRAVQEPPSRRICARENLDANTASRSRDEVFRACGVSLLAVWDRSWAVLEQVGGAWGSLKAPLAPRRPTAVELKNLRQ